MTIPDYLKHNAEIIRKLDPEKHVIEINNWQYKDVEKEIPELREDLANRDTISRKDLMDLSRSLKEEKKNEYLLKLFILTMIWGYGKTGYGNYRINKMITDSQMIKNLVKKSQFS